MDDIKWGKLWRGIVVERGQSRNYYNKEAGSLKPASFYRKDVVGINCILDSVVRRYWDWPGLQIEE